MKVNPISIQSNYSCNKKQKMSFYAHPDFYKYNSIQSCYFRRGAFLLASKGYLDIEELFYKIFKFNDKQKNMLIIGICRSQEPFSYLASIKGILNDKSLKNNIDLNIIDLQSKPTPYELKLSAFPGLHDYEVYPKYAEKSFVYDSYDNFIGKNKKNEQQIYGMRSFISELINIKKSTVAPSAKRVNDEIFKFLSDTYNNPQKAKWNSRVQDAIQEYPDKLFDIISANNVIPYIMSENEISKTLNNIKRVLKTNGYFITDPYEYPEFIKKSDFLNSLQKEYNGIYKKISI